MSVRVRVGVRARVVAGASRLARRQISPLEIEISPPEIEALQQISPLEVEISPLEIEALHGDRAQPPEIATRSHRDRERDRTEIVRRSQGGHKGGHHKGGPMEVTRRSQRDRVVQPPDTIEVLDFVKQVGAPGQGEGEGGGERSTSWIAR